MLQYFKEKKEERIKEEVGTVPSFNPSKYTLFCCFYKYNFTIKKNFNFCILIKLYILVADVPILPGATSIQNPQAAQLQNRILSILNTSLSSNAQPVEPNHAEKDSSSILKEPNVQKALESLFQGGSLLRK